MLAVVPTVLSALLSWGLNYVPFVESSEGEHGSSWGSTAGRWAHSRQQVLAKQRRTGRLCSLQHWQPWRLLQGGGDSATV